MHRPATLAEIAERRLAGVEMIIALPEFLDDFYVAVAKGCRDLAQAKLDPEPPALPDRVEHALLGAVGEHLARRWSLRIPEWVEDPSRFLDMPHFTCSLEGFKALQLAQSPLAFRRRLIFTEGEPLRRARMPRSTPSWSTSPDRPI